MLQRRVPCPLPVKHTAYRDGFIRDHILLARSGSLPSKVPSHIGSRLGRTPCLPCISCTLAAPVPILEIFATLHLCMLKNIVSMESAQSPGACDDFPLLAQCWVHLISATSFLHATISLISRNSHLHIFSASFLGTGATPSPTEVPGSL